MRSRWLLVVLALVALLVALASCPPGDAPDDHLGPSAEVIPPGAASPAQPRAVDAADDEAGVRVRRRVRPESGRGQDPEPAPAPFVAYSDGEIPESDREPGESSVTLTLVDEVTDRPVSSLVRLWRLDVPADDRWPAGDHVQAHLWIDANGTTAEELPAGRYRLEVLGAAIDTPDPPPFSVPSGEDGVVLRVTMPQMQSSRLTVLDENGTRLTSCERTRCGAAATWGIPVRAPAWASPRVRSPPGGVQGGVGGRGGWRRAAYRPTTAASDGTFPLPEVRASGRHMSWSDKVGLRFEGRVEVEAQPTSDGARHGRYIAVAPRRELVLAHVVLPDGATASDAAIKLICPAIPHPRTAPDGVWRTIPVRVSVELPGFEPLTYEWRIAEAPYPLAELVPSKDE